MPTRVREEARPRRGEGGGASSARLREEARPSLPAGAAGLTLDGGTLYASLANDRVAVIDLATFRVAGGFATGKAPDGAVVF